MYKCKRVIYLTELQQIYVLPGQKLNLLNLINDYGHAQ